MMGTFMEIVGIISSLVTLEEGGRSWIKEIARLRDEKDLDLSKNRSENENVKRNIDHLIQYLASSNRTVIYGEDEIKEIEEEVFASVSQGYYEKKELHEIIVCLFQEINAYISKHLTIGEKVVIKELHKINNSIENLQENLKDKKHLTTDKSRFITDIAPNPPSKFNYRQTEINDIEHMQKKNIAICGIGGIGKTSILRYMYHHYLDETQYYLGWIPYSGDIKKDVMDHCLLYKDIENVEERENLIKNYLREQNKQVYLFIDDVTEEVIKDIFFQFLCYTARVFISTRYWSEDEYFSKYEINAICPEDAVHLFWDYYTMLTT